MTVGSDPRESPQRLAAAHVTVAALALAGAITLQASWTAVSLTAGSVGLTIVVATLWLLSTAWLHNRLRRQPIQTTRAGLQAASDVVVVCLAGLLLQLGHDSSLAHLWLMPPVLLAVAATSAVVLAIAALTASNQTVAGTPTQHTLWRIVVVAALAASLSFLIIQPYP
jgi:hypothetical protein